MTRLIPLFYAVACTLVLSSGGALVPAVPAVAKEISTETGKSICKGKAAAGSGCAWCTGYHCTYVACDDNACDIVVVPVDRKEKAASGLKQLPGTSSPNRLLNVAPD